MSVAPGCAPIFGRAQRELSVAGLTAKDGRGSVWSMGRIQW
jgi:hypothetical protein